MSPGARLRAAVVSLLLALMGVLAYLERRAAARGEDLAPSVSTAEVRP